MAVRGGGALPERRADHRRAAGLHRVPLARGDARAARLREPRQARAADRPRARDGRAGAHVLPSRRRPDRRRRVPEAVAGGRLRRRAADRPRARLRDRALRRPAARRGAARPGGALACRRRRRTPSCAACSRTRSARCNPSSGESQNGPSRFRQRLPEPGRPVVRGLLITRPLHDFAPALVPSSTSAGRAT